MDKSSLVNKLLGKKKDYTYSIAFFLIFSFFIFFVIRPNLLTVFEAQSKIDQLKDANSKYEDQINKIINLQASFESSRENLIYLDEAIAKNPELGKILTDLKGTIEDIELEQDELEIAELKLKEREKGQTLQPVTITASLDGTFDEMFSFIKTLHSQRRLKSIKELSVSRENAASTESASLKIKLVISGFYL